MTRPLEREQNEAAAARIGQRTATRAENLRVLEQPGGIARADTPERVARRMDRLASYHLGEPLPTGRGDGPDAAEPEALLSGAARRIAESGRLPQVPASDAGDPGRVLESVVGVADFLEFRYLGAGAVAGRAVGRIVLRDEAQRLDGYGTGSLVAPRLLLTNHHVLPDAATAARAVVQFDYAYGLDGKPLPEQQFGFDPDAFFVTDGARDFALVAVAAGADELAQFGFNPLIAAEGKVIVGERVSIVQHPEGEMKQVALRDQLVVDVADTGFLYYLADTEHGSSGSPVFNDQWEVVALHHASVARAAARGAPADTPAIINEGVRASRILRFVEDDAQLSAEQRALLDAMHGLAAQPAPPASPVAAEGAAGKPQDAAPEADPEVAPAVAGGDGWVEVTVPLEIRVRVGGPATAPQVSVGPAAQRSAPADDAHP